jgi:hypothetical protein
MPKGRFMIQYVIMADAQVAKAPSQAQNAAVSANSVPVVCPKALLLSSAFPAAKHSFAVDVQ